MSRRHCASSRVTNTWCFWFEFLGLARRVLLPEPHLHCKISRTFQYCYFFGTKCLRSNTSIFFQTFFHDETTSFGIRVKYIIALYSSLLRFLPLTFFCLIHCVIGVFPLQFWLKMKKEPSIIQIIVSPAIRKGFFWRFERLSYSLYLLLLTNV